MRSNTISGEGAQEPVWDGWGSPGEAFGSWNAQGGAPEQLSAIAAAMVDLRDGVRVFGEGEERRFAVAQETWAQERRQLDARVEVLEQQLREVTAERDALRAEKESREARKASGRENRDQACQRAAGTIGFEIQLMKAQLASARQLVRFEGFGSTIDTLGKIVSWQAGRLSAKIQRHEELEAAVAKNMKDTAQGLSNLRQQLSVLEAENMQLTAALVQGERFDASRSQFHQDSSITGCDSTIVDAFKGTVLETFDKPAEKPASGYAFPQFQLIVDTFWQLVADTNEQGGDGAAVVHDAIEMMEICNNLVFGEGFPAGVGKVLPDVHYVDSAWFPIRLRNYFVSTWSEEREVNVVRALIPQMAAAAHAKLDATERRHSASQLCFLDQGLAANRLLFVICILATIAGFELMTAADGTASFANWAE